MNQQRKVKGTSEYALALCGGGGKGAYQIGVWKALEELGVFCQVKAISGTSVGALNAVLMAIGDFDNAKKIWYSIEKEDLLSGNVNGTSGLCSREGLIALIKSVPLYKLHSSIPVYINLYDVDSKSTISVNINQLSEDNIIEYLLASSAMPVIYGSVNIEGRKYLDGGYLRSGNVPIEILYKEGYRNIIVSALENGFNLNDISDSPINNPYFRVDIKNRYPDTDFTELKPLKDIGILLSGTLDFSKTGVISRMVHGYIDTLKIMKKENLYFMKNQFTAINIVLKNKMQNLFHSQEELEAFVEAAAFKKHNTPLNVTDFITVIGYTKPVELYGWTLQQGKLNQNHYRLVDPSGKRQAWFLNPEELLEKLEEYEAVQKFL